MAHGENPGMLCSTSIIADNVLGGIQDRALRDVRGGITNDDSELVAL